MLDEIIVLNDNSKVPLYIQLKEQIKEYILAGNAREDEPLPPLNPFAEKLGINFETVRKAYKELEREGFLVMKRGLGTFFNQTAVKQVKSNVASRNGSFITDAKELIKYYLKKDLLLHNIRKEFDQALSEVFEEFAEQRVIFTECSAYQTKVFSEIITQALTSFTAPSEHKIYIKVQGVLLSELRDFLDQIEQKDNLTLVTTGFHYDEVKEIVGQLPIYTHVLITNMDKETRQELESFGTGTKYGFISQSQHVGDLFADIFKEEFGDVEINSCPFDDLKGIEKLIKMSDVILVSPAFIDIVQKLVPPDYPLVIVNSRVDRMSLKLLKDRLISGLGTAN